MLNEQMLYINVQHCLARMADAVSVLPFTTEFQVKPGRTGVIAGWVTTWV